jgi:hypothetical protein
MIISDDNCRKVFVDFPEPDSDESMLRLMSMEIGLHRYEPSVRSVELFPWEVETLVVSVLKQWAITEGGDDHLKVVRGTLKKLKEKK